jgi:hypothetical protein
MVHAMVATAAVILVGLVMRARLRQMVAARTTAPTMVNV